MGEVPRFLNCGSDELMNVNANDDDDDYIPESLASFVAEANRTLADAKLSFLTTEFESKPPSSPFNDNQSLDTTSNTVILVEDEDDILLKKELMDSSWTSSTPFSLPNRMGIPKKELFPHVSKISSFDMEDSALEDDIASFFQVDKTPPLSTQVKAQIANKKKSIEDEDRTPKITKTPIRKKFDSSITAIAVANTTANATAIANPTTTSFWGSLTSKLVGTPILTKTLSGSSSSSITNKAQVAPEPSAVPNDTIATPDVSVDSMASDSPLFTAEESASSLRKTKQQQQSTQSYVGSSHVHVPANQYRTPALRSPAPPMVTSRSPAGTNHVTTNKSLGASTSLVRSETTPKTPAVFKHSPTNGLKVVSPSAKLETTPKTNSSVKHSSSKSPAVLSPLVKLEATPKNAIVVDQVGQIVNVLPAAKPSQAAESPAPGPPPSETKPNNNTQLASFQPKNDAQTSFDPILPAKSEPVKNKLFTSSWTANDLQTSNHETPVAGLLVPGSKLHSPGPPPFPQDVNDPRTGADASRLTKKKKDLLERAKSRLSASRANGISSPQTKSPGLTNTSHSAANNATLIRKATAKVSVSTASRIVTQVDTILSCLSPNSQNEKKSINAAEAVAKAKERVRQRKLMEKKDRNEEPSNAKLPPLVTATKAIRSSSKVTPATSTSISTKPKIAVAKPRVDVAMEAKRKLEEERRARMAEKVRSVGSGTKTTKPPKISTAPVPTRRLMSVTSSLETKKARPKLTNPKPFNIRGKDPVQHTSRHESSSIGMMESIHDFLRKGLRHSTPRAAWEYRPGLTTPKPFKFVETTPPVTMTPATTMEEKKKSFTLGEKLLDYDKHLRDVPIISLNLGEGPTIPMSPKFTSAPSRGRPKSTVERESEIMEYYESHPFKAAPILTELPNSGRGLAGIPKVDKKKLTVPVPFRLSSENRGAGDDVETGPSKDASNGTGMDARRIRSFTKFKAVSDVPPRFVADDEECKKQFKARPLPDFKTGSKSTPVVPKRFNSLRANTSKTGKTMKIHIPATIEVRNAFSNPGMRATPSSLGSTIRSLASVAQPMPSRLRATYSRSQRASNEEEMEKQFKARPLPVSTYLSTASITSRSKVPCTISISSAPKLATEERREKREAAMLASRINAELLSRERASLRQRKQEEKHKEEMRKASPSKSPSKSKAESTKTINSPSSDAIYKRKMKEEDDEETRARIRNFELSPNSKPIFDFSPTKLY